MHVAEFPISTPVMVLWAVCLAVAVFFFVRLLNSLLRKSRRTGLLATFGLLLLCATAVHVVMLSLSSHTVTHGNWIQLVLVSLVAGLEMFIGHTVIFDDIIAAVVFHMPGLLLSYLTVFVLILCFSFVMVFQVLPRRMRDRFWLFLHRRGASADRKNHIFIGINPNTKLLAKSILEDWKQDGEGKGVLLFIDIPEKENVRAEVSLGDIFTSIVSRRKEVSLDEELGSDSFVLLKGSRPVEGHGGDLCSVLELERLRDWFHNPRTSVWLLGDETENIALLDRLLADSGVTAKVFCLADRLDGIQSEYSAARGRVRLIDTHLLSVQQIKFRMPEVHPIHFVERAAGKDGEPLGYVASGFHSMHVGFRRTGQEALRFVYEFGSFVGRNRRRVPTTFDLFDDNLEQLKGDFLNSYPGMREDDALVWNTAPIGSTAFWDRYSALVEDLNYVVVSAGDVQRNIDLGVRMLQTAARAGKEMSRFVILVRVTVLDERVRGILELYNRTYCPDGAPVLRAFGAFSEIWNLPTVTGMDLKEQASQFYSAYQRAVGGDDSWEKRSQRLTAESDDGDKMRNLLQLHRVQGQDLSRSAFIPTMRSLAGEGLREAAIRIPDTCEGSHFPDSGPAKIHLEYLAVQERLRWNTSHRASGYVGGSPKDELLKRIPDLKPYDELKDPAIEHFDWIAVRTALSGETKE